MTTRRDIFRLAWPVAIANAAVPLLGIADTAVIGNTGTVEELGAIALGALVFGFVYWSFGFLRMGTTGFIAQASGAGDTAEIRAALGRALLIALGIGLLLLVIQRPVIRVALALLGAGTEVEELTRLYFGLRIWGAPATLGTYAVIGTFVGLGRMRHLLATQLLLNGLNIGLDVWLGGILGWGVEGIAIGTAIAEWVTFLVALRWCLRLLAAEHTDAEAFWPRDRILDPERVRRTVGANADILVRTLFLMLGMAWFTDRGAQFGDEILAANHILMQLINLSAYLLDGYAHATEVVVGRSVGARDRVTFDGAVRSATELAAASAVGLGAFVVVLGPLAIAGLTDLQAVRATAGAYLPLTAAYVAVSFAAFQLDGIFIGATATTDMRNASVVSCLGFVALSVPLMSAWGNLGLWVAFVGYVAIRALALGARYPALRARVNP